jgi:trk system potassium uptake protein
MNIIIVGDGKVGYSLAENLSKEGNSVTIIEKSAEALKKAAENLDVICIRGSGASTNILLEAGVKTADLLIAATTSDEMNMVCCLTAKKMGAKHTIARIRDPEYANELTTLKEELGLDMVINPEEAAAREAALLLRFPTASDIETFSKGKINLIAIKITGDLPLVGMRIKDISHKISSSTLICIVEREKEVIIPRGDFRILEGDILHVIGKPASVFNFCRITGKCNHRIKNVMIVGGGRIAYYLTRILAEIGIKAKILEIDKERCIELTELLPEALIIHGDGSDESVLLSENLGDMDAFVALTGRDEENMMAAMLAKHHGVLKVITKINRMNYSEFIGKLGLDSIITPKLITTNHIVKYTRGLINAQGSPIQTLYKLIDDQVEAVEFKAGPDVQFLNIPLKKLNIKKNTLVAGIVRGLEIIIPHGSDSIKQGDHVILITIDQNIVNLNDMITGGFQHELQDSLKKLGNSINV